MIESGHEASVEKCIQRFRVKNQKKKDHLEDLGVDERILKWI
jgi:hypothetical protein